MATADAAELVALAERLARDAGALAAAGRRDGRPATETKSTATDMVTTWDRASEQLILHGLRDARPDDGIVGEEGGHEAGRSGVVWLVDPIDGTTNFWYDLPGWAVSIAAADDDGTLAGVVYVPVLDELYAATRGGGATLNGEPIRCSSVDDPAVALLATGFSYDPMRREQHARRLVHVMARVRDLRRLGAASVDLCHVAAGRVDAYVEEHLGPLDVAAGELIAREAGCRSGDLHGGPATPRQVLVANPSLFDPLAKLLRDAWTTADRDAERDADRDADATAPHPSGSAPGIM